MFRKSIISFMVFSLLFSSVAFAAPDGIKLFVNNVELKEEIISKSGYTYLPMRSLFEYLGAKVDWAGVKEQITAVRGDTTVVMTVGIKDISKNGEKQTLPTAPIVQGGKTYVPVRVAEVFGYAVGWNDAAKAVLINDESNPVKEVVAYDVKTAVEKGVFWKDVVRRSSIEHGWWGYDEDGIWKYHDEGETEGNEMGNVLSLEVTDAYFINASNIQGVQLMVEFEIANESTVPYEFELGYLYLNIYYDEKAGITSMAYEDFDRLYCVGLGNSYVHDREGNPTQKKFVSRKRLEAGEIFKGETYFILFDGRKEYDLNNIEGLFLQYGDSGIEKLIPIGEVKVREDGSAEGEAEHIYNEFGPVGIKGIPIYKAPGFERD